MHTGDLGALLYYEGSVLWELLYDGPFVGTDKSRVGQLWSLILRTYDVLKTPSRIPILLPSTFARTGDFARLSCKAAHAKHLLFAST